MKTHQLSLTAVSLTLLAACGGSQSGATSAEPEPSASLPASGRGAPGKPAGSQPAASQPAAAQPQQQPVALTLRPPVSVGSAELEPGPRSPAELAMPFAVPEDKRHSAAPFPDGLTIDTPLVVRGKAIPADLVRHMLIAGVGVSQFEYLKLDAIIANEIDRRQQEGDDIRRYLVSDAELQERLDEDRESFVKTYPTLDYRTEIGRNYLSYDLFVEPVRLQLMFERLFMPPDPADWPELSLEVLRSFGGEPFVQDAFDSYALRKQQQEDQGLDELPPDDPFIVSTWRELIRDALVEFSEVVSDPAQLPPGVLMRVDGRDIPIDAAWGAVAPHVSEFDLAKVRRLLVLFELLEADLASRGELLSQEEFEKVWVPDNMTYDSYLAAQYSNATNTFVQVALYGYARYCRILESLRRAMAEEVASVPDNTEFLRSLEAIAIGPECDVEVILSSAWDGDKAKWKENGWREARERSFEVMRQLQQGGDWKALRELHCEFWDPPLPEVGQRSEYGFRFKGALGSTTINRLMGLLDEGQGYDFLFGASLANRVFYSQQIGSVIGPLMGPKGYYICLLTGRSPGSARLDMIQESHRDYAVSCFLREEAKRRAHELALAAASEGAITGL